MACDRNGGIAKDDELPWHNPEDMKHFRQTTMGASVIMGRTTYECMGALPGRENIICSRSKPPDSMGVKWASSPTEALKIASCPEIYMIGGAGLLASFEKECPDRAGFVLTVMDGVYDCDTFIRVPDLPPEAPRSEITGGCIYWLE